jgi:hypothetical protein
MLLPGDTPKAAQQQKLLEDTLKGFQWAEKQAETKDNEENAR